MERATSDPSSLADLFRLDHLTTRMRRHAEGLLNLAGSTPGRGWREPVLVADALNAAVSEVKDYVRVDVVTDSSHFVTGTAVNDVIHLLAELIENATAFSPPHTRVEIRGDLVSNGFAIEIEDRGLGIPAEELVSSSASPSADSLLAAAGSPRSVHASGSVTCPLTPSAAGVAASHLCLVSALVPGAVRAIESHVQVLRQISCWKPK